MIDKLEIIATLMTEMNMTEEEALREYERQFESSSAAPKIPFPLAKVNHKENIAPLGALVWGAIRNENKRITGFENVHAFEDIDFVIFSENSMYNCYDREQKKVVAKTLLGDVFTPAKSFKEVNTGQYLQRDSEGKVFVEDPETGKAFPMTNQKLVTVGIRPKGTQEPFIFLNMYLKKTVLRGFNLVLDKVRTNDNSYKVLNISIIEMDNGDNVYAGIDTKDGSTVTLMEKADFLANMKDILTANKAHREYVEASNAFYSSGDGNIEKDETDSDDELPN